MDQLWRADWIGYANSEFAVSSAAAAVAAGVGPVQEVRPDTVEPELPFASFAFASSEPAEGLRSG